MNCTLLWVLQPILAYGGDIGIKTGRWDFGMGEGKDLMRLLRFARNDGKLKLETRNRKKKN